MVQSNKKTKEPIKVIEKEVCKEPIKVIEKEVYKEPIKVKEKAVCAELTERTPVDTRVPRQVTKLEDGTVREDY